MTHKEQAASLTALADKTLAPPNAVTTEALLLRATVHLLFAQLEHMEERAKVNDEQLEPIRSKVADLLSSFGLDQPILTAAPPRPGQVQPTSGLECAHGLPIDEFCEICDKPPAGAPDPNAPWGHCLHGVPLPQRCDLCHWEEPGVEQAPAGASITLGALEDVDIDELHGRDDKPSKRTPNISLGLFPTAEYGMPGFTPAELRQARAGVIAAGFDPDKHTGTKE